MSQILQILIQVVSLINELVKLVHSIRYSSKPPITGGFSKT